MRQHSATFANFVLHFGTKSTLLSYLEQIVLPAFTSKRLTRKYGSATYSLLNVSLWNLGSPNFDPVIAGQFVKDTILTREQVLVRNQGLVADEKQLRSSPSAYFVLSLKNHRLSYYAETNHCPNLQEFKGTIHKFLKETHNHFVRNEKDRLGQNGQSVTLASLFQQHPEPILEIVPFVGTESLRTFVSRYGKLKRIDVTLVRPNPELDGGDIFDRLRKQNEKVGGKSTKVSIANNEDGLNLEESAEFVSEASQTGNEKISLTGTDKFGGKLDGNNENFHIQREIRNPPVRKKNLAKRLFAMMEELEAREEIKQYRGTEAERRVLNASAERFR